MQLRQGIGFPSVCRDLVLYRRPVAWRDPNGFYRLLGLTPAASEAEIRRAGRRLLARYHPDGSAPDQEQFLCVSEAYRTLTEHRNTYDTMPDGHVIATHLNKDLDCLAVARNTTYDGWSYFSEVPRLSDDQIASLAYEQFLFEALRTPTSMSRIAVALIEGTGTPWLEDGLIYVPVSGAEAILGATPGPAGRPNDKADKGHVTT